MAALDQGTTALETPRGPVQVARAGQGPPVLIAHGGPGGFDQGLAFVGEGAYDGLIAVFDNVIDPEAGGTFDLHGFIFEGGLPPAPEPYGR